MKEKVFTDNLCVRLNTVIEEGFPEKRSEVEDDLKPFWQLGDKL